MSKYEFTPMMGEISGFGGDYEAACRTMLIAGLEFWDTKENFDPKFQGFKDVFGILSENNKDAEELSDVVAKSAEGCTGAMHQAVIQHIFFIRKNGWDKYVEKMSEPDETEVTN